MLSKNREKRVEWKTNEPICKNILPCRFYPSTTFFKQSKLISFIIKFSLLFSAQNITLQLLLIYKNHFSKWTIGPLHHSYDTFMVTLFYAWYSVAWILFIHYILYGWEQCNIHFFMVYCSKTYTSLWLITVKHTFFYVW